MLNIKAGIVALVLLPIAIVGFPETSRSSEPPVILPEKTIVRFSPYHIVDKQPDGSASGEQWVDKIEINHKPLVVTKIEDNLCSVSMFRDIISLGQYALMFFSSHGRMETSTIPASQLGIEVYGLYDNIEPKLNCTIRQLGYIVSRKQYLKDISGTDLGDPEVWAANSYPECDDVDNDNDGIKDNEIYGEYRPEWDNNEDGVMGLCDSEGYCDPSDIPSQWLPGVRIPCAEDPQATIPGKPLRYCGDADGELFLGLPCPGRCVKGIRNQRGYDLGDDDNDQFIFDWNGEPEYYRTDDLVLGSVGNYYQIMATRDFIMRFGTFRQSMVFDAACFSRLLGLAFTEKGVSYHFGYDGLTSSSDNENDAHVWIGGMGGVYEIQGEKTNADPMSAFTSNVSSNAVLYSSVSTDIRIYNPPRIVAMSVTDSEGEVYHYQYGSLTYPYIMGFYPDNNLLDLARIRSTNPGTTIQIEIQFTREMNPGSLSVRIVPKDGQQDKAVDADGNLQSHEITGDTWVGTATIKEGFPEGDAVVEVQAQDAFTEDIHDCLDTNGDGDGHFDELGYEIPCVDTNHIIEIGGGKVKKFEEYKSPELVSLDNPGILGETVEFRVEFTGEMDPTHIPILGIISGIHKSMVLDLFGAHWEDGVDDEGQPLPNSVLIGTWNIPNDLDVGGQDYLRLEFDVAGVYTKSGKQLKTFTEDREESPLLGWYDLVRPRPTVIGLFGPDVECGSLDIYFAIDDEPSYYEPGSPIEPPSAKFGRMDLLVEKKELGVWALLFATSLSDPRMHFVGAPPWAKGDYRWWVEVEDSAGNLDQISFEQQGMERTAAVHFGVTSCEEQSTFCNRLNCNAEERRCDQEPEICDASSTPCNSCYCDDIEEACKCIGCPPDPDQDDTFSPGNDGGDENNIVADMFPRMSDVENENPDSRVGVLRAGYYTCMFTLLDMFGEQARLVEVPLSPEALAEVKLLIVPSGGLRNQQTEEFAAMLDTYVSAGGKLLVLTQPHGDDFGVVPGDVTGYGWQQDRSCFNNNLWRPDETADHPIQSSLEYSVLSVPVDGHFTGYPPDGGVFLRKISNNRPVLVEYAYGAGAVAVSGSYLDFEVGLRGGGVYVNQAVRQFRDLVTWLKDPVDLPRLDQDQAPVDLNIEFDNDAPGYERAAMAKLLVMNPDRTEIAQTIEQPIDLDWGESGSLVLAPSIDWETFYRQYGIWHVGVELYDAAGNLVRPVRESLGGRFVHPYPHDFASYTPGDIQITLLTDKETYLWDETAHFTVTVENSGTEERNLRIRLCRTHCLYDIEDHDVVLSPGESLEFSRDRGREKTAPRYDFFCRVFDTAYVGNIVAQADKVARFIEYPVVLEALNEDRAVPGQALPVEIHWHNLADAPLSGTISVDFEGSASSSREISMGPGGSGETFITVNVPQDARLGANLSIQGRFANAAGRVLGSFYSQVEVYTPIMDMRVSQATDKQLYHRGEQIHTSVEFQNDSDQDQTVNYEIDVGDLEENTGAITVPAGAEQTVDVYTGVPWDFPTSSVEWLHVYYWDRTGQNRFTGYDFFKVSVPSVEKSITDVVATPAGVDAVCSLANHTDKPIAVGPVCRLVSPGGVMVAEDVHDMVILDPMASFESACHLPLSVLERGVY